MKQKQIYLDDRGLDSMVSSLEIIFDEDKRQIEK